MPTSEVSINSGPLLELRDVEVRFNLRRSGLLGKVPQLRAVDGVTLTVGRGQVVGTVPNIGTGSTRLVYNVIVKTIGPSLPGSTRTIGEERGSSLRSPVPLATASHTHCGRLFLPASPSSSAWTGTSLFAAS